MKANLLSHCALFTALFLLFALFPGASIAAASIGPTGIIARNVTAVTPAYNVTNASGSSDYVNFSSLLATSIFANSAALQKALERGPMVYAATSSSVLVIDSSTREVISTIKPGVNNAHIDTVAVSPDGQFVYTAVSWSIYQDDPYGGHYDTYSRVLRINATSQQAIDYFEFDMISPEHLAVSPDGRVYLGFQQHYYPDHAGVKIMDFQQGKSWYLDYDSAFVIHNFEFSPDGNRVYFSGWWDYPSIYELDWAANKVKYNVLPGNASEDVYARSLAVAKGGKMIYAAMKNSKAIFAMNTEDHGKQVIPIDYYPQALAASPDGETLFVIGYIYDSNNNPLYFMHEYGGLKTVGPFYNPLLDYMLATKETFYMYDAMDYITPPAGTKPSQMAITPDGRYGYISTVHGDGVSDFYGNGVMVYDLAYLNPVKTIDAKDSRHDVAASQSMIVYAPAQDYSWAKEFAKGIIPAEILSVFMPTSFHPSNGTFAKTYKEDFFVVYATFTDYLDNNTLNNGTFWVTEKSGTPVPGKAIAASKIAIFSPYAQLKPDTDYVAHLSKSIKSKSGNPLYAEVEWSFTTRNESGVRGISPSSIINMTAAGKIRPLFQFNFTLPPEVENQTPPDNSQAEAPEDQVGQQGGEEQTLSPELNPQPEPPGPQGTGTQTPSPELNPQPEPPGPQGGQTPSPELNPQPEPPSGTGQQPQEPAGNDFIGGIISFFKSLFGLN